MAPWISTPSKPASIAFRAARLKSAMMPRIAVFYIGGEWHSSSVANALSRAGLLDRVEAPF
ncbi:hypothetical protein V1281_006717 [Nitrobacteraceae bacterium AZCC 2161]